MKKALLSFLFLLFFCAGYSQNSFTATLPGSETELKAMIEKGNLVFEILTVTDAGQVDFLNNKAVPYTKEIGMVVTLSDSKGARAVATLNDGAKDMKWLFRYFLNAGITTVNFNGKSVSTQEFFKPWM
ncbi:MAG: hypothetical protein IT233_06965 [Bacteroidia bacterium]|nr:hypothetical protein [Bacteroidia bacterium]